ncbi:murein biosynthesis protein MurJ, partial [Rhodococcus hoagii]|nr:murein biosynthesis protein MurJ [Prescottella equi]
SSVSYVYQFVLTHVLTVRRFGDYGLASVLRAHVQTGLAALAAAAAGVVVVWLLGGYTGGFAWNSIGTALLTCAVAAVAMGPVYLMVLRAMRFPELDDALRPLVARVPALGRLLRVG